MDSFIFTSLNNIKRAINRNKFVVFVGSGVSRNSGLPDWTELIELFIKELYPRDDVKNFQSVDFIKIPQIFYNDRGKKEYLDFIKEKFDKKVEPNLIHESIFKLNPSHIITTNYDNLLEKSCGILSKNYHIIGTNADLPKTQFNNFIIKMHGDFDHDNIVLKEEDYWYYSRNFNLIETYVKSLFATHLILFVGFSATDSNFKKIFDSVKDVLSDDFQPAYLLESNKNFERLEFDYFKHKGINILYLNEIESCIDIDFVVRKDLYQSSNNKFLPLQYKIGIKTNKFMRFIYSITQNRRIPCIEEDLYNFIEFAYDQLKVFEFFNILMPEDIINAIDFERKILYYQDWKLYLIGQSEIQEMKHLISNKNLSQAKETWKNLSTDLRKKIRVLINILKKTAIHEFVLDQSPFYKTSEIKNEIYKYKMNTKSYDEVYLNHQELLFGFNYIAIDNLPKNNTERDEKRSIYEIVLNDAFICHKTGKHIESFHLLKNLSHIAFENRDFLVYYIIQSNLKHLSAPIFNSHNYSNLSITELREYHYECQSINLHKIFNMIPQIEQNKLKFLNQIIDSNFLFEKISETINYVEQIHSFKKTIERGGSAFGNAEVSIKENCYRIWHYVNLNNLILEADNSLFHKFYKLTLEAIYTLHSIDFTKSHEMICFQKETLHFFWIYLSVVSLKKEHLIEIFENCNLHHINIDEETNNQCLEAFENLLNSAKANKFAINFNHYIENFLTIFTYINFTDQKIDLLLSLIIKNLPIILLKYRNSIFDIQVFRKFLSNQEKYFSAHFANDSLVNFINEILRMLDSPENFSKLNFSHLYVFMLFKDISKKLKSNKYVISNDHSINSLIKNILLYASHTKTHEYDLIKYIIIPIFEISDISVKKDISIMVKKLLKSQEVFDNNKSFTNYIEAFSTATICKTITPNRLEYKNFISYITKTVENNWKSNKRKCEDIIRDLEYLILLKIINPDEFSSILKGFTNYSNYLSFYFHKDEFDYNKFDIWWLKYLHHKTIKSLLKKRKANEIIFNKFIEIIENGDNREYYSDIFKKYFLSI